jgi:hypothetical protein
MWPQAPRSRQRERAGFQTLEKFGKPPCRARDFHLEKRRTPLCEIQTPRIELHQRTDQRRSRKALCHGETFRFGDQFFIGEVREGFRRHDPCNTHFSDAIGRRQRGDRVSTMLERHTTRSSSRMRHRRQRKTACSCGSGLRSRRTEESVNNFFRDWTESFESFRNEKSLAAPRRTVEELVGLLEAADIKRVA